MDDPKVVVKQGLVPLDNPIYERANGVTYAPHRDPYNVIERWVVGGDQSSS